MEAGRVVGPGDVAAQTRQTLANVDAVLRAAGASHAGRGAVPDVSDRRGRHRRLHAGDAARCFPAYFPDGVYPPNTLLVVSRLVNARAPGRDRGDGGEGGDRQGGDRARPRARAAKRKPAGRRRAVGSAAENDRAGDPEIPERFNAATFFVDRHVAEGRGGRVAFHHDGGTLTYAGLQELVNRDRQCPPGARRRSGAARAVPAPRLAGVPGRLLGRDQGRRGAGPAQHHAAAAGLSLLPQRQPGPHPGGVRGAVSRWSSRSWARRASSEHVVVPASRRHGALAFDDAGGRASVRLDAGGDLEGRRRPSGSTPPAPPDSPRARCTSSTTWSICLRYLCAAGPRHDGRGPHGVRGQALLRLRPRQQHVLPHGRGRAGRALSGPTAAGGDVRADRTAPADALLRDAHALRGHAADEGRGVALRPLVARASACRRARRCRKSSSSAGASGSGWRFSTGSAPPRSCTSSCRTGPAGSVPAPPGCRCRATRRAIVDDEGHAGRARRDREPAREGRLDHGLLLEPAREDQEHPLRPVDQHRRQVLRGRGRLLLVLRPRATTC